MDKKLITFICTGNTCRSIMAENIFKKIIINNKRDDLDVFSAGISPMLSSIPQNTIDVLKEYNITEISGFARSIDKNIMEKSFLILTMTQAHKDILLSYFYNYKDKIFALKEYVGELGDISDPYGSDLNTYKKCAKEIEQCLNLLIKKI